jgi:1,4-dihydroxy-2-naphthoyl-CoA synthase
MCALTSYEGDWAFQKLGPQKVKVSTYGYANPEGSIPLSVTNMFVAAAATIKSRRK